MRDLDEEVDLKSDDTLIGDEFDLSKSEDGARRAYPVLRIMAKTRRWLQKLG